MKYDEMMAFDIALSMNTAEGKDVNWYRNVHRDSWIKAVKPYADEIERLREENSELIQASKREKVRKQIQSARIDAFKTSAKIISQLSFHVTNKIVRNIFEAEYGLSDLADKVADQAGKQILQARSDIFALIEKEENND